MPILEARGLGKTYQMGEVTVEALVSVDLAAEKGEFSAIMGPSGSGKSTLLHLLGGLDKPSQGEVYLDGLALSSLKDDDLAVLRRRRIGFVFQFFNLLPTLTAEENVALPLLIDGQSVQNNRPRIHQFLDLVGLGDRKDHRPDQLSGGEQQRVAIARALVTEPAILLADEPTGNLDTTTGQEIIQLLRYFCDQMQQTVVLVTHDREVAQYADGIVHLRDGRIVGIEAAPKGVEP